MDDSKEANEYRKALVMIEYLTECTLATVESLAARSKPPKHELARQISIAQTGIRRSSEALGVDPVQGVQEGPAC